MCRNFEKCDAKIRNLCMSQPPNVVTFALHFGGINKDDSDIVEVIF